MHNRLRQFSLISLVLIVGVVACGPFAGTISPTAQPPAAAVSTITTVAQPTATSTTSAPTSTPTSAASATPAGPAVAQTRAIKNVSGGLDKLKSYRALAGYKFDGKDKTGKLATGSLDFRQEVDNTSQAQHLKIAFAGSPLGAVNDTASGGTPGAYETYNLGGNQFVINGGKCQFVGSGVSTTARAIFSPDAFIGIDKATLVGRGVFVNGVISDHYTFTEAALSSNTLTGLKLVQGDAWVSWDGYVVKVTAQAAGTANSGAVGTANYNYDVDSINALPAIVQPADCIVSTQAGDVPVPSNATEKKVVSANGQTVISFKSPDSLKTVADFYRQTLPPQGWVAAGEKVNGAININLTFTKESGKRTLMILIAQGAVTTVIIVDKPS